MLTPEGHIRRTRWFNNLGYSYSARFLRLGEVADFEKVTEHHTEAISLIPEVHANESQLYRNLGVSYQRRFYNLRDSNDIKQAARYFEKAANDSAGSPSPDSSALSAYTTAMRLVHEVVWLGATISHRYDNISSIGDIAAEAAAAVISAQKYDLALEWVEEGLSIVWKQTQQVCALGAIRPYGSVKFG